MQHSIKIKMLLAKYSRGELTSIWLLFSIKSAEDPLNNSSVSSGFHNKNSNCWTGEIYMKGHGVIINLFGTGRQRHQLG